MSERLNGKKRHKKYESIVQVEVAIRMEII